MQKILWIFIIVLHDEVTIPLRRSRARALVENRIDFPKTITTPNTLNEIILTQIVCNIQIIDIQHFFAISEIIDNEYVRLTTIIQCFNNVTTNLKNDTGAAFTEAEFISGVGNGTGTDFSTWTAGWTVGIN